MSFAPAAGGAVRLISVRTTGSSSAARAFSFHSFSTEVAFRTVSIRRSFRISSMILASSPSARRISSRIFWRAWETTRDSSAFNFCRSASSFRPPLPLLFAARRTPRLDAQPLPLRSSRSITSVRFEPGPERYAVARSSTPPGNPAPARS